MDVWWIVPAIVIVAMICVVYAVLRSRGSKMDRMVQIEQRAAAATVERNGVVEQETSRRGQIRTEDLA